MAILNSIDIPCGPIMSTTDLANDAHIRSREMYVEMEDEKRGKWIELINSGIFRPESLAPYGITQPVIAWGMGLERLAMLLLGATIQDLLLDQQYL